VSLGKLVDLPRKVLQINDNNFVYYDYKWIAATSSASTATAAIA
jgi:hypothetical protein